MWLAQRPRNDRWETVRVQPTFTRSAMKAAVVTQLGQPVEIQDRQVPEPSTDQVLVRIEASGLCHTDIHAALGDWPVKPSPPFIPGHEGVGIVEKLGSGVTGHQLGDRVAIAWLGHACGDCRYCVDGRETLCESQQNSGYSIDGAFAEYAVVDAAVCGQRAGRGRTVRCCATELRGPDVVQVGQGRPRAARRDGCRVRHRRTRPPRCSVRAPGRCDGHRRRHRRREAGAGDLARRGPVVNAAKVDPVVAIADLGGADVALAYAVAPVAFNQAFASTQSGRPPDLRGPSRRRAR